jgi:hypothetical protein
MCLLLGGCVVPVDGQVHNSGLFVGIVRLKYMPSHGRLIATDVATLGAGSDGGAFLGWRHSREVRALPDDCRVIIYVEKGTNLAHVQKILQATGGNPCIITPEPFLPPR